MKEKFKILLPRNFYPRNVSIYATKTYIYGSIHSGKTTLALQYASTFSSHIYVNLDMIRSKLLRQNIIKNIIESSADILIIDNFSPIFLEQLHRQDSNILDSKFKNQIFIGDVKYAPKNFHKLRLLGLSFEEYLSFDKKNLSVESLFASFIKDGNNIEMLNIEDFKKQEVKWNILKLGLRDDFLIFYYMLSLQSIKTSTYGIYKFLKQNIKISKDRIYESINSLEQNNIIFLCRHIDFMRENINKKFKLYFYDFSLSEFSDSKHFNRLFENMIFLELLSMGFNLVYDELCDFIDLAKGYIFLCTPFSSLDVIKAKIESIFSQKNKPYKNFKLIAITMNLNSKISPNATLSDFTNLSIILTK